MRKNENMQKIIRSSLCGLCFILTGCGAASLAQEAAFESAYENDGTQEETPVDIYTSSATVVIESVNEESQELALYMIDRNERVTFGYDGATAVQDKYGSSMAIMQLQVGDIADISYNDEVEKVGRIVLSGEAWNYNDVARYTMNTGNGSVTIGEENYSLAENVLAFSEGEPVQVAQIIHQDVLSFQGMGHNVMSITVEQGHGYLELKNADAVLGGWIEVGQALISQIAPDMLLTVPEGTYTVRLTSGGIEENREVTIERDKVAELDLGDIEIPEPEAGVVIFEVTPSDAKLYVDDVPVKASYPVRLSLGIHRVTAEASGYDSLSEYVQVEGESITVRMNLEKAQESTVSGNNLSSYEENKGGKITIETPEDVNVYQDNLYIGTAPVTYDKTSGQHTITLRREGYITRSYDIVIADDDKDVTYAFPALEPEEGASTVSGNSVSTHQTNQTNQNKTDQSKQDGTGTVSGNSVSGNSINDN